MDLVFWEFVATTCLVLSISLVLETRRFARHWRLGESKKGYVGASRFLATLGFALSLIFCISLGRLVPTLCSALESAIAWCVTAVLSIAYFAVIYMPLIDITIYGSVNLNNRRRLRGKIRKELDAYRDLLVNKLSEIQGLRAEYVVIDKKAGDAIDGLIASGTITVADLEARQSLEVMSEAKTKELDTHALRLSALLERVDALIAGKPADLTICELQRALDSKTVT